jgi:ArsR family transcriptional regulator
MSEASLQAVSRSINLEACRNNSRYWTRPLRRAARPIADASLDPAHANDMARMFKALSDPVRLRLLMRITSAEDGEICVRHTAGDFDVCGPTTSHRLKLLREAGLIDDERGTRVYYRPVTANLRQLATLLDTPSLNGA